MQLMVSICLIKEFISCVFVRQSDKVDEASEGGGGGVGREQKSRIYI